MENILLYSLLVTIYIFITVLVFAGLSQSTKYGVLLDKTTLAIIFFWWILLPIIAIVELIQGIKFIVTGE